MGTVAVFTGAEFDQLPYEEGRKWELVEGDLILVPSATPEHQIISQRLVVAFYLYLQVHPGAGLSLQNVEFALEPNTRVRPDVLFLSAEQNAKLDRKKVPVPFTPDLAVEIISPSERPSETRLKMLAYLRYGAQEVWQIYPVSRSVVIHRNEGTRTITSGALTSPLLPGFTLNIDSLFD